LRDPARQALPVARGGKRLRGYVSLLEPPADLFPTASILASEKRAGGSAVVASGDRDFFQLASPSTTILYPSRGGQLTRIGPKEVGQRYGVAPKQVPDFIALRGDPSDKLPRARGVERHCGRLSRVYQVSEFCLPKAWCPPKTKSLASSKTLTPRGSRFVRELRFDGESART
jgi:hypothetical protein